VLLSQYSKFADDRRELAEGRSLETTADYGSFSSRSDQLGRPTERDHDVKLIENLTRRDLRLGKPRRPLRESS
jgi:hypothetical protein